MSEEQINLLSMNTCRICLEDEPNMDALIKDIKRKGGKIGVFPISENNWIDTGVLKSSNTDIL